MSVLTTLYNIETRLDWFYAAGLPSDEFMKYHMTCHEKLKGHFASSTAVLCPAMCSEFHSSLFSYGETGQKLMYDFVQEAMFEAITKELFGRDNMPKNKVSWPPLPGLVCEVQLMYALSCIQVTTVELQLFILCSQRFYNGRGNT